MTTRRQIKRLLTPLTERHDDLYLSGQWLFLRPVRHVLRGICMNRTSDANLFDPAWAIRHLCEPTDSLSLSWGARIGWRGHLWEWNDPALQETLFAAIEEQALPRLRAIQTLDDFFAFACKVEGWVLVPFDFYLLSRMAVDVACGRLDETRTGCVELMSGPTRWSRPPFLEDFVRVTEHLCPLLAENDVPAMAALLHDWEAYTVEKLGIGAIWEKTPFPLERSEAESRPSNASLSPR